ncbi:hypothetical protein [Halorussus caseinilyticus]|nr:hypothetical protein [Halorussus sp. DT72]
MREELASVGDIYGSRDDVPADVTSKIGVSTGELRELLAENYDVFHFIGHIDGQGFECPDGILDAKTVEEVNATTVLLNGCRSHDQGVELVKAGASAAIVSLADLFNSGAVEIGKTLSRLLYHGFGIGAAMKIIREYTSIGNRYVVVGDPLSLVAQCESGIPTLCHISKRSGESSRINISPHAYPTQKRGIGSSFSPSFFDGDQYYIAVGKYDDLTTTRDAVEKWTATDYDPLVVNRELVWSGAWFQQDETTAPISRNNP